MTGIVPRYCYCTRFFVRDITLMSYEVYCTCWLAIAKAEAAHA